MTRYRDVADDVRRRILDGEFGPGERLPGEQSLAAAYGASRGVIRNALAALARRGLVSSQPGSGWWVRTGFQTQEFARLRSFAEWARARGMTPGGLVVRQERRPATATDAGHLRMRAGDEVLRVTRLRTLDARPVMVERTTYAPWTIPIVEALPADEPSVMSALLGAGVAMASGTQRIDTVPASGEDAELLSVRRSLRLLRVQRRTYAPDGRAVEHGDDRYAPETVAFEVHASASAQSVGRAEA
ncbi:MAG: GntR family transcriptional regulator [Microbacterium sp.]